MPLNVTASLSPAQIFEQSKTRRITCSPFPKPSLPMAENENQKLLLQISRVLNEAQNSDASHNRKLKELIAIRTFSSSIHDFTQSWWKTLSPLFAVYRRASSTERIIRFVALFSSHRDEKNPAECDAFLEEFLGLLLSCSDASNKTVRFRSCQIISEIIMRLQDDAEVSNELWDEVIDCMKRRMQDKIPIVRAFAVRALARFVNDSENGDIVDLYTQALACEQNSEVRKMIVLSMPPSNATSLTIIERTLDVIESVRKAAYCVLASKFPLQSLSIKLRTIILRRGLSDRSQSVRKECLKLLKDAWLVKCCDRDPLVLLKFLDVETYESVGEAVLEELLKAGMVRLEDDQSIRHFLVQNCGENGDQCILDVQLLEAEVALYWRILCRHLQTEAQAKGCDAAATAGTEAAVYAAEASDSNDLLDKVLPATVADYVALVKAHLAAGMNYRFASRQLLLLGVMLDFSDATNRKVAGAFIQELLHRPLEHEDDGDGNKIIIGDGINLGGDKDWARAVSELARKVHASAGEFEDVVIGVIDELACPCRERSADFMQWLHCLAVTGLLLENVKSIRVLQGKAIEPSELLQSLLIPGAKHIHADVRRVAIRCLGLFGLLERKPNEELIRQLRLSFVNGSSTVSIMAAKALLDLGLWHGPEEVDRAMGLDLSTQSLGNRNNFTPVSLSDGNDPNMGLLDLLYSGFVRDDWGEITETNDHETVQAVLAEGFAKMLLQSKNYPTISAVLHPLLLGKLISLYFSEETKKLHRLRQCLSVFFEHYPATSADHKRSISKSFVSVMRSMWPGVYGNSGGAPTVVSALRKRAILASRFMLQMMQTPLYALLEESEEDQHSDKTPESPTGSRKAPLDIDSGEEGLGIRLAAEVVSCPMKKNAAGKSYALALCKIVVLLHFRPSAQDAIKCMRRLIDCMVESVSTDKQLVKDLMVMTSRLKAQDVHPDQELSDEQAKIFLGKLGLDDIVMEAVMAPMQTPAARSTRAAPTPAPRSTKAARTRRQARRDVSSDEGEGSPISVVPMTPSLSMARSQRASKTAAMSKMAEPPAVGSGEESMSSDMTSEEASDSSDETAELE